MWIAVAHTAPFSNAAAAFRNDFDEAIVDTNLSLPQKKTRCAHLGTTHDILGLSVW